MLDERNLSKNKRRGPVLDEKHLSKPGERKPSDPVSARLYTALESSRRSDQIFRQKFVKRWAVQFIDVSETSKEIWQESGVDPAMILREFQAVVRPVLERHEATYISDALDSPQVAVCFENPEQAAEAAIEVQHVLVKWNTSQEEPKHLVPSIGIHIGDVVYNRGELQQSNTCNLAKRVQTEAKPGQIFLSKPMYNALEENSRYVMNFMRRAQVKNIPMPQDIFQLGWADLETDADHTVEKVAAVEGYSQRHAILFIDVTESSKKFWTLGDRMGNELIRDYQNIVEPVLKKNGSSYQESGEGDQVMACFPGKQPQRAVEAAIEIQRLLFHRNSCMDPKKRVQAAIGLHIGDIVRRRKEIIRTADLMTCKGIQGEAGADEIYISKALYEIFEAENRFEMNFIDTFKMKGVEEPQDVYQVVWYRTEKQLRESADRRKIEQGLKRLTQMK